MVRSMISSLESARPSVQRDYSLSRMRKRAQQALHSLEGWPPNPIHA